MQTEIDVIRIDLNDPAYQNNDALQDHIRDLANEKAALDPSKRLVSTSIYGTQLLLFFEIV